MSTSPDSSHKPLDDAEARTPSVVKPTAEGERKAAERKTEAAKSKMANTRSTTVSEKDLDGTAITERRRVDSEGTDTEAGPLKNEVKSSLAGRTWVALSVGIVLLVLLLIFIIQNMQSVSLTLFFWDVSFPAGVGFLIAAIIGAAIMASVGAVRIYQLRKQVKDGPER